MFLSVCTHILQSEAFRKVIVHLNGAQLPFSSYGILDHKVQFRSVESSLSIFHNRRQALFCRSLYNCRLSLLPVLVGTYVLCWILGVTQGNLSSELFEVQCLEYIENDVDHLLELFL